LCASLLPLKLQIAEAAASGLNSITADTSVLRAVSLLKISKEGDSDRRHAKVNPKLSRLVDVSGLLSLWSYPMVMELVTSALTLLSFHAVFQFLCHRERTAATDTTDF